MCIWYLGNLGCTVLGMEFRVGRNPTTVGFRFGGVRALHPKPETLLITSFRLNLVFSCLGYQFPLRDVQGLSFWTLNPKPFDRL